MSLKSRLIFADDHQTLDLNHAKRQRFFGKGLSDTMLEKRKDNDSIGSTVPPEHDRLKLLAGLIYAQMAGTATVEEIGPGQLRVQTQGGTFRISVGSEGRVLLSGFSQNPNLEQHVGKLKSDNLERSLLSVVENISTLITDSIDGQDLPEPVYFPSNEVVNEIQGGTPGLPSPKTSIPSENRDFDFDLPSEAEAPPTEPESPAPVQDVSPSATPPLDTSMPPIADPMSSPAPAPSTPPGFNIGPPTASKIASKDVIAALEGLADELETLGMEELAKRVDVVTNTLDES